MWVPPLLPAAPSLPRLPSRRVLPAAPAMPLVMIKGEGISLKKYADTDGKVHFELLPGRYRIEVIKAGCKKWVRENFIKEDKDQDLMVNLTPAESQPIK